MSRHDINCSPFHHKRYTPGTKIWYRKASFYSQNYWSCIILASACSHFRAFTCAERTYFLPKMCMVLSAGWDVLLVSLVSACALCSNLQVDSSLSNLDQWQHSVWDVASRLKLWFTIYIPFWQKPAHLDVERTATGFRLFSCIWQPLLLVFLEVCRVYDGIVVKLNPMNLFTLIWHEAVLLVMLRAFLRNSCVT